MTALRPDPHADTRVALLTWVPEAVAALVVLVAMVVAGRYRLEDTSLALPTLAVAGGTALAVLLARHLPGVALGVVWLVLVVHLTTDTPFTSPQVALALVAFGCARWGTTPTVVASALSMPAAGLVMAVARSLGVASPGPILVLAPRLGAYSGVLSAAVLFGIVLVVPWAVGLAVRASDRARVSQEGRQVAEQDAASAHREADQAREIAALRDQQAQLARDVHDVVGHSLAVILAQAESAQFLPDDPARLKQTLATIVTSARGSLSAVREVLDNATGEARATDPLDDLVAGVRASGREVAVEDVGRPRPLPPELAVVAERVLQEMLTNAVKHGRREHPVRVERHWPEGAYERDLRLEVSNAVAPEQPAPSSGRGLDGMARRLEAVGGRFDVRRRGGPDGDPATFTATAWVPVRAS